LTPRITFPKTHAQIQTVFSRFVRRPSLKAPSLKVTLGAAAVAAMATAGLATAVSAGPTAGAASHFTQTADVRGAQHAAGNRSNGSAQSNSAHRVVDHAPAKHQPPAKHQAPAKRKAAPVKHKAARHAYRIYDSVTPSALPAHNAIATYSNGSYAVSPSQVAGHKTVLWIDVTGYNYKASVLDVEPGDATPQQAANWAWHRLHAQPRDLAHIYTMLSEWPAVKAAIAHLPAKMRSHVRYWIADPTGVPHVVPGSSATQWYWGSSVDISTATPRF
jgi:hypothetical protein